MELNMRKTILCLALSSALMIGNNISIAAQKTTPQDESQLQVVEHYEFEPAKVVKRKNPTYPAKAARDGQEGWVTLNYAVNEQGKVEEVVVIDSSGNRAFEKNAMRAVKKWRYEPAKKNGEVVYACQNKVRLEFFLADGEPGVTKEFKRLYSEVFDALDNNDVTRATQKVTRINERDAWNFTEIIYANRVSLAYAQHIDDTLMQEYYANQSISNLPSTKKIEYDDLVILLAAFKSTAINGAYHDINKVYDEFFAGDKKLPNDEMSLALINQIEKIKSLVDEKIAEPAISRIARVNKFGVFHHTLSKNNFEVVEVKGQLNELEIRCDSKFAKIQVNPHELIKIPAHWGNCGITIHGDNKTELTIIEHQAAPTA